MPQRLGPLPGFQPGPLDAAGGRRDQRFEVFFDIAEPGDRILVLRFGATHGPCPDIELEIDGERRGLFHPRVRRADRSAVDRPGPIAGEAEIEVRLPAEWLVPGPHRLAVTTTLDRAAATGLPEALARSLDDEAGRAREQYGNWFGSGITWREIVLVEAPSGSAEPADDPETEPAITPAESAMTPTGTVMMPAGSAMMPAGSEIASAGSAIASAGSEIASAGPAPTPTEPGRRGAEADRGAHAPSVVPGALAADLVATPLYVEREGEPQELIELTVTVPAGHAWPKTALVRMGGREETLGLERDGRAFGQVRVRFPVPEWDGEITAEVLVDGRPLGRRTLRAARKWTLHLIPHVHLDVGFTDTQGKILELHSRNLDRALAAADGDFAFSVDGSMIVREYLATRSPGRAARVLAALRDGRMAVNAFDSLFLSGVAGLEEIYRAAYGAARLREEHGVPVTYANLTDVPSYSVALPSILRALGIDAFVGIANHGRGGNAESDGQHLLSPVLWEGPDGSRVLAHFADHYSQLRFMAADPQTISGGAQAIERYVAAYDRPDHLPSDLAIIGTHADNEDLGDGDAGFAARWNAVYAYPRIRVSTLAGYLDAVRPLADRLPLWRGDGGSYWEDGVGTGAAITAEHRAAQAALPVAEALGALTTLADDAYLPHRAELDRGWENLLYGSEHTWTWAHGSAHPHGSQVGDQLDWKRHRVHDALRVAIDETRRAMSRLGELVTTEGTALLVFNALNWTRPVEIETDAWQGTCYGGLPQEIMTDCGGLRRVRLTVPDVPAFGYRVLPQRAAPPEEPDLSGRGTGDSPDAGEHAGAGGGTGEPEGAADLAHEGNARGSGDAADPTGAAAYRPSPEWHPVPATLATERWEVSFDPSTGTVNGLRHRRTGRELLDPDSPWRLGQVLYVLAADGDPGPSRAETAQTGTGQTGPGQAGSGQYASGPGLAVRPAHSGVPHEHRRAPADRLTDRLVGGPPDLSVTVVPTRPVGLRRTHDGWRLRTVGRGPSLPHVEVDVLLRDRDDRVDVAVRLEKESVLAKESVYVAFPFAADEPRLRYDRQQGWVDPAVDHSPGACQEWFTTQHGVVVESRQGAIAWCSADAPLFTAGDVVRGTWATRFEPRNGTVLSWVMNNHWPTNTPPEQEGSLTLRYAFTPMPAFDPAAASRFGLEVRGASAVSRVTALDKFDREPRRLGDSGSLADLDAPHDLHVTIAEPRDRLGLLLRVRDLAGTARQVTLRSPYGGSGRAILCHADERELGDLPVRDGRFALDLRAWQVATVRLRP
ncbi:hypothetical protein AB0K60_15335 [Thermopolyspora sp. NPDC052614]|uniref:glycoside hydrolase family 38 N-terminal domain-containing protein n=1 Tax=Thermopolyspora sp. NPDC052614 TaxID=3155682 RepID=UPI00341D2EB1